ARKGFLGLLGTFATGLALRATCGHESPSFCLAKLLHYFQIDNVVRIQIACPHSGLNTLNKSCRRPIIPQIGGPDVHNGREKSGATTRLRRSLAALDLLGRSRWTNHSRIWRVAGAGP